MEKTRIIIVDDESIHLKVLEKFLGESGYDLKSAADGESALKMVREEKPDLVVLDVMMPGMDGLEVCRRLKEDEETLAIPVIITTSLLHKEDRLRGLAAGAEDFLTKPVDGLELTTRVKNLLKIKAYHDQLKSYNERLEADVETRTRELKKSNSELQRMNDVVKKSYLDTIIRLAMAAEYKDKRTGCHIRRMSRISAALAGWVGMSDAEVDTILYASPMHDIGKIGIPDRILLKPGSLDPDEWEIMKLHTRIGSTILSGSDSELLRMAEQIALLHHERFDGTGYPHRLIGEEIPLPARITAVADVFDALISERPYKKAYPMNESLEIIKDGAGSHFDPTVTKAFFDHLDAIIDIVKDSRDDDEPVRGGVDQPSAPALRLADNFDDLFDAEAV